MKRSSMSLAAIALLYGAEEAKATKLSVQTGQKLDVDIKAEILAQMNEGIALDSVHKAIQEEKMAEETALEIEKKVKHAKSKHQKKKAKKQLEQAKAQLKNAEQHLAEVSKNNSQDQEKLQIDESEKEQEAEWVAENESEGQTGQMKEFFQQSAVYKQFLTEKEQEADEEEDCDDVSSDLLNIKSKYHYLEKKYHNLQQEIVHQDQDIQEMTKESFAQKQQTPLQNPSAECSADNVNCTSNELPDPNPLVKPLYIESQKDYHDMIFTPNGRLPYTEKELEAQKKAAKKEKTEKEAKIADAKKFLKMMEPKEGSLAQKLKRDVKDTLQADHEARDNAQASKAGCPGTAADCTTNVMPVPTQGGFLKPLYIENQHDYHDLMFTPNGKIPESKAVQDKLEAQAKQDLKDQKQRIEDYKKFRATLDSRGQVVSKSLFQKTAKPVDPTTTNNQAITDAEEAKDAGCPGSAADCTTNVMPIPTKKWIKPLFPEAHKDFHDFRMPSKVVPAGSKLPEAEQQKADDEAQKKVEEAGAKADKAGAAKAPAPQPAEPAAFSQKGVKIAGDPTKTNNQAITDAEEAKDAGCPGSATDCTTNVMPIPTKKWIKPLFPEAHKDFHDLKPKSNVQPAGSKLPEAEQQKNDDEAQKKVEEAGAKADKAGAAKAPPPEPVAAFSQKGVKLVGDPTKTNNQAITDAEEAKSAGCPGSSADCDTMAMPIPTKQWIKPLFKEGQHDYHDIKGEYSGQVADWQRKEKQAMSDEQAKKVDEAEAKQGEAEGAAKDKANSAKPQPAAFSQKTKKGVDPTDTNNQKITEEEDAKKVGCPGLSADCTSNVMPIPSKEFLKPLFLEGSKDYYDYKMPFKGMVADWTRKLKTMTHEQIEALEAAKLEKDGADKDKATAAKPQPAPEAIPAFSQKSKKGDPTETDNQSITAQEDAQKAGCKGLYGDCTSNAMPIPTGHFGKPLFIEGQHDYHDLKLPYKGQVADWKNKLDAMTQDQLDALDAAKAEREGAAKDKAGAAKPTPPALTQQPAGGPPAELTKPVGTLPPFKQSETEKKNPHVYGSKEGPWNNVNIVAQVKRIDPLEHRRYGEGNVPSTNQEPIPLPLTQPLNITNIKDEHDFKMPYPYELKGDYHGQEIVAQSNAQQQAEDEMNGVSSIAQVKKVDAKKGPADLVPAPKEPGMEPDQLHQPLTKENQVDADDIKHWYNPEKKPDVHSYSQNKGPVHMGKIEMQKDSVKEHDILELGKKEFKADQKRDKKEKKTEKKEQKKAIREINESEVKAHRAQKHEKIQAKNEKKNEEKIQQQIDTAAQEESKEEDTNSGQTAESKKEEDEMNGSGQYAAEKETTPEEKDSEATPEATPEALAAMEKAADAEDKAQQEHDRLEEQAEKEREAKKFSEREQIKEDQITAMVLSTVHTKDPIEMAEKMDADNQPEEPEEMTKKEKDEYELAIKEAQTDSEMDKSLTNSMAQEEKYGNLVQKSIKKTKLPNKLTTDTLIMLTDEEPKEMDAAEQKEYKNAITLAASDAQKAKSLNASMVQEEKYGNLAQKVRGPPGHANLLQISSDKKDDLSDAMKEMAKEDAKEHDKPKKDKELSKKPTKMDKKEQAEYDSAVEKTKKDVTANADPKAKTLIQLGQQYPMPEIDDAIKDKNPDFSEDVELASQHPSDAWFAPDFVLNNGRRPIQLAPHGGIVPDRRSVDTYPQGDHQLYKPLTSENQVDNDDIINYYNPALATSWHHADYVQKKDDLADAMKEMAKEDARDHDKPKKDKELSKKPTKMDKKEQSEYDAAVEKTKKDVTANADPKAKTLAQRPHDNRLLNINPHHYGDLVAPPRELWGNNYQEPEQLFQPLTLENQFEEDDWKNYYVPNRIPRSYAQVESDIQINPHHYGDLVAPPRELYGNNYQEAEQLYQPLTLENQFEEDDFKNYYVPNRIPRSYAQQKADVRINPHHYDDLVPAPKEPGMIPEQLYQPLTLENQVQEDDYKNYYNANRIPRSYAQHHKKSAVHNSKHHHKKAHASHNVVKSKLQHSKKHHHQKHTSLAQALINPHHYGDLVAPPRELYGNNYQEAEQLYQPLTLENQFEEDDFKNYYVPNRIPRSYAQMEKK